MSLAQDHQLCALKRTIIDRMVVEMQAQNMSKSELARRMGTSRSLVDRTLDPTQESSLSTLMAAANALGKHLHVSLRNASSYQATPSDRGVRALRSQRSSRRVQTAQM